MTSTTLLPVEQRDRLAEYHVLNAYDLKRIVRYGDMAASRRTRELNRLADALLAAGVKINSVGEFPESTPDELVAAFERVGAPRLRRLERETAPVTLYDGTVYTGTLTRYNGTSLKAWQELEAELLLNARAAAPIVGGSQELDRSRCDDHHADGCGCPAGEECGCGCHRADSLVGALVDAGATVWTPLAADEWLGHVDGDGQAAPDSIPSPARAADLRAAGWTPIGEGTVDLPEPHDDGEAELERREGNR